MVCEKDSTGPWSHDNSYYDYMGEKSVFDKFHAYEDADGFFFLSFMQDCSEDDTFAWTYYPPNVFKILIYFPEYDSFLMADGTYERYAFDSYFTVEVTESGLISVLENTEKTTMEAPDEEEMMPVSDDAEEALISVTQSYDFAPELLSLVVRVVATIMVEIVLAILFAYRDRKSLGIIAVTNVFTQVVLNVLLNVVNYRSGYWAFLFNYVWMELLIFALEATVYAKIIGRTNPTTGKKLHPCLYALVANLMSFLVGMWIAKVIPGVF